MTHALFAEHALLPSGWARDVLLQWDARGQLTTVTPQATPAPGTPRAAAPCCPACPTCIRTPFSAPLAA